MSLTCMLVDDEPKALTSLKYELQQFKDRVEIVSQFSEARSALVYLEAHTVDVVFLDINMPNLNGMKFLDAFSCRNFEVIFTTAHSEYAIDAFKKEALDYLVKPIDQDDLDKALQRAEKKIQQRSVSEKIEEAMDRLNSLGIGTRKIKLNMDKKVVFLEPDEILYCESDGNYCKVFLENEKELFLTQKLKQVAEQMPPPVFYRVHNSYLINMQKVKEFYKNDGCVMLKNGKAIPVSRQKRNEVLERL